jgi:glucosyl-3-phosphoglycerate synthase
VGDFHQTASISTLHRFHTASPEQLESELEKYCVARPITLVLPTLCSELNRPAFQRIVAELREVRYLHQIVVSLDNADGDGYQDAKEFFAVLPQRVRIIWNSGERARKLYDLLDQHGLKVGPGGKGFAVWIAVGYALAEGGSYMVALHDCDIVNYERGLLTRLCYPIANPNLNYEFCKGYYCRVTDRLYGRVTRLFITPLIFAMQQVFGYRPILDFLGSFRYPLAGEIALTTELARVNRIHRDWGMDFGLLAEVFQNCSRKRICQVDLIDSYDHKHQLLSESDPQKGLLKMSIDIARVVSRTMASEGAVLSSGVIETLQTAYLRNAQDMIKKYHDVAMINNLPFDRCQEDLAVETFARGLRTGGNSFLEDPLGRPELPNWIRVTSAIPHFLTVLRETVECDQ